MSDEVAGSELVGAAMPMPEPTTAQASAPAPPRIGGITAGSVVDGRYEVLSLLAAGGQGAVYEVRDRRNGRIRALKVLLGHHLRDPSLVERFRREATVTAQIESEHLVEVLDAGSDPESQLPYLVMERLRGRDLSRLLADRTRLPWREVVLYLRQAALAIDKAHQAGILHRDLKPENLFLTTRDDGTPRIRVFDFGIAKTLDGTSAVNTQLVGTPLYMSPEQLRSEDKLGPGVDVFALGHVAFTLLVGREYWTPEARLPVHALLLRLLQWMPDPPTKRAREFGVELPPSFDAWMQRACAPLPADRFGTATAAIDAFERTFEPLELDDLMTRVQTGRTDDLPALVDDEAEAIGPESQTRLASSPHATGPLPAGSWPGELARASHPPELAAPAALPEVRAHVRRSTTASFASTSRAANEVAEVLPSRGRRLVRIAGLGFACLGLAVVLAFVVRGAGGDGGSTSPSSSPPAVGASGAPIEIAVTPQAIAPPSLARREETVVEARPMMVPSASTASARSGRPAPKPSASAPPPRAPVSVPSPPSPPSTAPQPPAPPGTAAPPRRGID